MKNVFDYIDYRRYLADYYDEAKRKSRAFSYRYFAQKAGVGSPSFLKHVIDGKRNLTRPVVEKFSSALKLNAKEAVYFRALVLFNQARTAAEKQEHYALLRSLSGAVREAVLKTDHHDYFATWYTPVIRELVCLADFKDNHKEIASTLSPPIGATEARKAVALLLRLKLVKKQKDGTYVQTSRALIVEPGITSMAVRTFTDTMMGWAREALGRYPKSQRHISGLTVGVSKASYDMIIQEIEACRDRIKTIVDRDADCSRVYQLNTALFPVTEDVSGRAKEGES